MPKTPFVNFKAVKAAITMEQVLHYYGLSDQFKKSGDSLSGPCPIHEGSNPTQFRVSISKNIWNCFSKCDGGGNVLDFIARMDDVSIHAAALKAIDCFQLDPEAMSVKSDEDGERPSETRNGHVASAPKARKPVPKDDNNTPNKPLGFRLDKLDSDHPYLTERGLTQETIIDFGVGFCAKGVMADRIAIPIRNPAGFIVAYAGRWPGEPSENTPKYKLPQGFRKSLELFNIDRAIKEPPDQPLIIVEGFFDCMKLHQHGCKKVIALMGSGMSVAQEELLCKHIAGNSHVVIMLDEDEAGQVGRGDIACRLSRYCFVKVHQFDAPNTQPEHLSAEEVQEILEGL